jgi:hypothetical protein
MITTVNPADGTTLATYDAMTRGSRLRLRRLGVEAGRRPTMAG